MLMLTRPDRFAEARVSRFGTRWLVTGHQGGEPFGQDGLGREYAERDSAIHAAVQIAYGRGLPALGARSGDTWIGMGPEFRSGKAA